MAQVLIFRTLLSAPPRGSGFEEVVDILSNIKIAAPMYMIAAGTEDGIVIARGNDGPAGFVLWAWMLSYFSFIPPYHYFRPPLRLSNASNYFIAQTNYDHWQPDPAEDPRRTALEHYLNDMGPHVGTSTMGLFAAISTYPVHNPHTAYTAVMQPKTGLLTSFVRTSMFVHYLCTTLTLKL